MSDDPRDFPTVRTRSGGWRYAYSWEQPPQEAVPCHARRCDKEADLCLHFFNRFSFRTRPAGPLFYCHDHAMRVAQSFRERGLRVEMEPTS